MPLCRETVAKNKNARCEVEMKSMFTQSPSLSSLQDGGVLPGLVEALGEVTVPRDIGMSKAIREGNGLHGRSPDNGTREGPRVVVGLTVALRL